VVNHVVTKAESSKNLNINFQPMPAAKVNRKPAEERTWTWWSIIIRDRVTLLKSDDVVIRPSGQRFKIESANDWRESGFTKYEAIEDYEEST